MQLQTVRASILAAMVVFAVGCAPAANEPVDGGGGGGAGGGGPVTYTKDVQPILKAKCAPCHTELATAGHNVASTYADAKKPNESHDFDVCWKDTEQMMPKTVGECALLLIQSGRMPPESGCGSPMPLNPAACLSDAQKATIAAWVAAGMPE